MVFLKRFFCLNTRQGCILMSVLMTAMTLVRISMLLFYCVKIDLFRQQSLDKVHLQYIAYATLATYGVMCLACLCLVFGSAADNKYMFLPWLLLVTPVMIVDGFDTAVFSYEAYDEYKSISDTMVVNIVFFVIRFIFWFTGFLLVSSQYHELADGRGSREYYARKAVNFHSSESSAHILERSHDSEIQFEPPPSYIERPPSYSAIFREEEPNEELRTSHDDTNISTV